jgi:hypothetical protein
LNNDLAPTFASWAGVTPPSFVDGRSLEPLISESPPVSWRSGGFLVEHRRDPEEFGYVRDIPDYDALRTARYHYVEYETGEEELYDASSDPTELDNLLAPDAPPPDPALLSSLKMRLDALKSCAGSKCRTAEDDTTPPVLDLPDDITAEATGPDGAKVGWSSPTATDEDPAAPEVTCTPPSGSTFPLGKTTVTCTATDAVGNSAQGGFDVTIRDTTSPTISVEAPVHGVHVSDTIALSANAADFVGVSRVEFLVDGVVVGTDTSAPYNVDWDTRTVQDGQATITANAYDAAENVATDSRAVTVDNTAPKVVSWSPEGRGKSVRANLTASFSESVDNVEANFELYRSGSSTPVGAVVTPVEGTNEWVLNPKRNLKPYTRYVANVLTGVEDTAGNSLDQDPTMAGDQPMKWSLKTRG